MFILAWISNLVTKEVSIKEQAVLIKFKNNLQ